MASMLRSLGLMTAVLISGCDQLPNNPYPAAQHNQNILYSSFSERPKHLDPAVSYSSNEYAFIGQIYQPPLHYHYLKRPYQLEPLTATQVPTPIFLDAQFQPLPADVDPTKIVYSRYQITINPGIRFQPHPAFAADSQGNPLYHQLNSEDLQQIARPADFSQQQTRELIAADYVHQIKRFSLPNLHSPIAGFLGQYILGLNELTTELAKPSANSSDQTQKTGTPPIDLDDYPLTGAKVIDRYRYEITIKGLYPQFIYWLAMPFFAPMPNEVTRFYNQPLLQEKNITLDWFPVGTGAYQLIENNPNRRMVLARNPNFTGATYPAIGNQGDLEAGLLADAGKPLPFIERAIYSLEKEPIPVWNKFLQGYYDRSGISSDSFDQAVQFGDGVDAAVSTELANKKISLQTSVATSTIYIGFNMLDSVVGGYDLERQKLRQAIAISLDMEEYISIFNNSRGINMHSPLPPGIFGYRSGQAGINSTTHLWRDGKAQRKSLKQAKQLLAEAGYPDGRHRDNGDPLVIHFDTANSGPGAKPFLDWLRKQLAYINIQLVVRATDYNRFQDKVRNGQIQMYMWGWNADYPDPENFLFLLYGPNSQVPGHGENSSNFQLAEFDQLFEQMRNLPNGPKRRLIIEQMLTIFQQQTPWAGGFHPKQYVLQQSWIGNVKPSHLAHDTLQYQRINSQLRNQLRTDWNQPVWWPLVLILILGSLLVLPAIRLAWRREHQPKSDSPT